MSDEVALGPMRKAIAMSTSPKKKRKETWPRKGYASYLVWPRGARTQEPSPRVGFALMVAFTILFGIVVMMVTK